MIEQFNEAILQLWNKLSSWFNEIILALPNIVLASIVMAITFYAARTIRKTMGGLLAKTGSNKTVTDFLTNLVVTAFMIIMLFVILNILNLSDAVTALLGTAGVIGLAIGLALQDPLVNLFSGVVMSVRDFYEQGDLVETNGFFGRIQKINLRSTQMIQPDGQQVIIPNKDVLQKPLKNFSFNGKRRIEISCGVSYNDDLEKAEKIAVKAIEDCGIDIRESSPIQFFYNEFGDSSINFTLRFWKNITEQSDYMAAQHKAIIALKKAFDANDISIPFPMRTLELSATDMSKIKELYPKQPSQNGESRRAADS